MAAPSGAGPAPPQVAVAVVVDSTALHADEMEYLLREILSPALRALARGCHLPQNFAQPTRFTLLECGPRHPGGRFDAHVHPVTADLDALLARVQRLRFRGGGAAGPALADGMAQAGQALREGGPADQQHCITVTSSRPCAVACRHGSGTAYDALTSKEIATRFGEEGIVLSMFATRPDPVVRRIYEANKAALDATVAATKNIGRCNSKTRRTEREVYGCLILSQIIYVNSHQQLGTSSQSEMQGATAKRLRVTARPIDNSGSSVDATNVSAVQQLHKFVQHLMMKMKQIRLNKVPTWSGILRLNGNGREWNMSVEAHADSRSSLPNTPLQVLRSTELKFSLCAVKLKDMFQKLWKLTSQTNLQFSYFLLRPKDQVDKTWADVQRSLQHSGCIGISDNLDGGAKNVVFMLDQQMYVLHYYGVGRPQTLARQYSQSAAPKLPHNPVAVSAGLSYPKSNQLAFSYQSSGITHQNVVKAPLTPLQTMSATSPAHATAPQLVHSVQAQKMKSRSAHVSNAVNITAVPPSNGQRSGLS